MDELNTATCAIQGCGRTDGIHVGDHIVRVKGMQLIPRRAFPPQAPEGFGFVPVCSLCSGRMLMDFGLLLEQCDLVTINGTVYDTMLFYTLLLFIDKVWDMDEPPTWNQIALLLNGSNVLTERGKQWDYHNIRQKALRIGINPEAICSAKPKRLPEIVPSNLDVMAAVAKREFGEESVNASWGEMPSDMPGLE